MKSILNVGKDLAQDIRLNQKEELIVELYKLRTRDYKCWLIMDECGTYDIFADIIDIPSFRSYTYIDTALKIFLEETDEEKYAAAMSLLDNFIRMSCTTEIPQLLKEKWIDLETKISLCGLRDVQSIWGDIKRWYRISQ